MDYKDPDVPCVSQWGSATNRYSAHGALYKHSVAGCASPVSWKREGVIQEIVVYMSS